VDLRPRTHLVTWAPSAAQPQLELGKELLIWKLPIRATALFCKLQATIILHRHAPSVIQSPGNHTSLMMEIDCRANPDTQFEVDIMILDYLVCAAINAILKARIAERHGKTHTWDVDGLLMLFDSKCQSPSAELFFSVLIRRSQLT